MSWIKNKTAQESLVILGYVSGTCARLGGPLCAQLNRLVIEEDYHALLNYEIDYSAYLHRDIVYGRQILALYQKLDFLELGIDRKLAAAERFVESEQMCLLTNAKLRYDGGNPWNIPDPIAQVLHYAQRKIADTLGLVPRKESLTFCFGPGANTNVKSALACPRVKLSASLECSSNLTPTVGEFLSEVPLWAALHAKSESEDSYQCEITVAPGKVMFVPKNAKTDRSIVIEPILNSFFQKGYGSYIKDRLLRQGINLYDQSINQRFAALGSVNGSYATVDLSMASDCLATNVVWSLLPVDWALVLDQLRTSYVELPDCITPELLRKYGMESRFNAGRPYMLEKFSSMGNGFTFELESLIFYGLCVGVLRQLGLNQQDLSVYGDDIIIPARAYGLLKQTLAYMGFRLNDQKSFSEGPFRESCGADYLRGLDIRPFYQKTLVSERTLYTMHNWFMRHCEPELAETVRSFCNHDLMLTGPDGFGDGHLIGSYQLRRNRKLDRDGWDGGYFDTYVLRPKFYRTVTPGDSVLPAYSVYTRSGALNPTDPDVIRGSRGYAKISIYTLVKSIFHASH